MKLSIDLIKSFKRYKIVPDQRIHQIEFLHTGERLACKSRDKLKIFDTLSGDLINVIHIKMITFKMLFNNNLIHSTPENIKYLSMYDNQYIRTFEGHRNVTEIHRCPINDIFISHSNDALCIWDLRYKNPVFRKNVFNSHSTFSKENLTLLINDSLLKTFDIRNLQSGPINTRILPEKMNTIGYLGNNIIAGGKQSIVIFNEQYTKIFVENRGDFSISPDQNFILCNSGNNLLVFDSNTGRHVERYRSDSYVAFNPQYMQFVTAGNALSFWMVE